MNMKWFHLLVLGLALLLLPLKSHAAGSSQWYECGYLSVAAAAALPVGPAPNLSITKDVNKCFYFDEDEDSVELGLVRVDGDGALITFFADLGGEANGNGAIDLQKCYPGTTTWSANVCKTILDAALDGTGGADGTQTMSQRVGTGIYAIINSATAASDEAVVVFEGE